MGEESATTSPLVRFGILGCADIARKMSKAITLAPNATLFAIGSHSLAKVSRFASQNGFPPNSVKLYGSYDAVLDDHDVDAVYLPLPTSLHVTWVVAAAQKKKHVLLVKPVALNTKELNTILEACGVNGVQFMDDTMWLHHPRTNIMKHFLSDSQQFGQLKSVNSRFTFFGDPTFLENDIRGKPDLDALGALVDVGWYCINVILWAADFELPKSVIALQGTIFNKPGVVMSCSACLYWESGKVATFHCSMDITAVGTKGSLHVHDFFIPFEEKNASLSMASGTGFAELETGWMPRPSESIVETHLPQESLTVSKFSRIVTSIKYVGVKPEMKWPTLSRKTQLTLDAVKLSIDSGLKEVEVKN